MRTSLVLALLAGVSCAALAETPAMREAGEGLVLSIAAPPEPADAFESILTSPEIRLPAAPDVVVSFPANGAEIVTGSLVGAPPRLTGLDAPDLPEPPAAHEAILNAPAPALRAAEAPPRQAGSADVAAADLPEPADPNALIAMIAPRPREAQPPRIETPKASEPAIEPPRSQNPAAPPAAAATLSAERLEQSLGFLGRAQGLSPAIVAAVKDFYGSRGNAAIWTASSSRAVLSTAEAAASHGLSSARFAKLTRVLAGGADAETREAALSLLAVAYARDARGARLNPQSVARLITATTTMPEPAAVLAAVSSAPDAGAALEGYNPRHPGYAALRRKLADLQTPDFTAAGGPRLTFGPVLTRGMSDLRVPILRDLLGLPSEESNVFDAALVEAVKGLQRERGLKVSGRLDRATTAALGGVAEETVATANPRADIIANMERWRWLPVELGEDHVFVNIPDFSLRMMRDGALALTTRVIVGKTETQTPVFSDRMKFLVVNPSWNVPPSILMKEYLPLAQRDPQALAARGMQVISNGRVVDPASVDWSKAGRSVGIRQPPGERNALGHVKFMFPNQHAVYLHDTPNRSLFASERRAFSHGCVRVQDPFRLAEALMGQDWPERRLRAMVGGGERQINFNEEIPVHLAYFTTFVDESGALQTRNDLYGHNRRVKALLGL